MDKEQLERQISELDTGWKTDYTQYKMLKNQDPIKTEEHLKRSYERKDKFDLLTAIKDNFEQYVARWLKPYQGDKRPLLKQYQEQREQILKDADEFPTLKSTIDYIDKKLDKIWILESKVFKNVNIFKLAKKEIRKEYEPKVNKELNSDSQ
jgi:hypothetical protein